MASQLFLSSSSALVRSADRATKSVLAAAAVVLLAFACSSSTGSNAGGCDDSKCLPGNKCLPLAGETKCRKTCSSNSDPATSCPFGYTCVKEDPEPFCVQDTPGLTKSDHGQWGASCKPSGGIDQNPDCDTAQGFFCFGIAPDDGAAYCTRYNCETDRDCGATFYCGDANIGPNVKTKKRTIGQTQKVCLKRDYCSPCVADLDCPPLDGRPQHCIVDSKDGKSFCTPECEKTDNCNRDAKCVVNPNGGKNICFPNAGQCVGDGSYCTPCRSDADCGQDGACTKGQYTQERFCAKKAASACQSGQKPNCPQAPADDPHKLSVCGTGDPSELEPKDFCAGVYFFYDPSVKSCATDNDCPLVAQNQHEPCIDKVCVTGEDIGCWTPYQAGSL